jgi:hypothetical protein
MPEGGSEHAGWGDESLGLEEEALTEFLIYTLSWRLKD